MQQAKLLLRLLLMQGSWDKSTLIVSAQICHYNLITNNRPLTFETAYQILILKVDWRPALLPPPRVIFTLAEGAGGLVLGRCCTWKPKETKTKGWRPSSQDHVEQQLEREPSQGIFKQAVCSSPVIST